MLEKAAAQKKERNKNHDENAKPVVLIMTLF